MRQKEARGGEMRGKGTMQEAVRVLHGDARMETEGFIGRAEGVNQEKLGLVRHNFGEALVNRGNAVKT